MEKWGFTSPKRKLTSIRSLFMGKPLQPYSCRISSTCKRPKKKTSHLCLWAFFLLSLKIVPPTSVGTFPTLHGHISTCVSPPQKKKRVPPSSVGTYPSRCSLRILLHSLLSFFLPSLKIVPNGGHVPTTLLNSIHVVPLTRHPMFT